MKNQDSSPTRWSVRLTAEPSHGTVAETDHGVIPPSPPVTFAPSPRFVRLGCGLSSPGKDLVVDRFKLLWPRCSSVPRTGDVALRPSPESVIFTTVAPRL
jgi:hypothetical protein